MKKILVVGESCRDIFVYCRAERLAPDLPVPVVSVIETKENPGMAKNVERNIKNIYARCDLFTNPNWRTVTKTRYVHQASNHLFLRVDSDHHMKRVDVKKIPLKYDIIAISDYNKGFFTEDDIKYLCEHHPAVFMDTKKILGKWAEKAKYIKINNYEYEHSKSHLTPALEKKMIVTEGDLGAIFHGKRYPVEKADVRDSSGAGDSFFAALLVKYAETGDIEEAIRFANICASQVVRERGVTLIRREK
jgi:bifunctional ADP-heptose synthase (sugar kinase/adenylyltransferase)